MRKVILVLALLAVAALASDPRLTVLGGDSRLLTNDYLEMWAYPGTIGDYQFVTGNSEGTGWHDGWFGINKDFGGQTLGVTINHAGYSHEVLYSPGDWGMILAFDFDKFAPDSISTQKNMEVGLAWGTDVPLFGNYSDLAFRINYDKATNTIEENETSQSDIMFAGSVRGHGDSFMNLFPIITASVDMYGEDYGETDYTETTIALDFGAGHNKMIAEKTNLVFGVFAGLESTSFGGDGGEGMDSQMWITVPRITGGVEQGIGKWLVFRAGATSDNVYYSMGDFNQFDTGFDTHFGVGLHWDNFMLDGTINEAFLHDGPYMVGGRSNGIFGSVAASYNF